MGEAWEHFAPGLLKSGHADELISQNPIYFKELRVFSC